MLLETGMTVREGVKDYTLKRDAVSLETPDGKTIPMASIEDFERGTARAGVPGEGPTRLDQLLSAERLPRVPDRLLRRLESRAMAWNEVDAQPPGACLGRVYFKIPEGITYGQHWLNVKFKDSLIRVPFRILTKEEDKLLDKNYKDIKKQVDVAFKPPRRADAYLFAPPAGQPAGAA